MSKITRSNVAAQSSHAAIVAHGAHPEYRLEFVAAVAGTATGIYQGSIVSVDANGEFVLGCGAGTGKNFPVPMISMKNMVDPDVTTGVANSVFSAVGGNITAIPVTGGYEIETTEFDGTVTYKAGDALTVDANGKVTLLGGTSVYGSTTPVIGFVSGGITVDGTIGKNVLGFFTSFFPAAHAE